MDPRVVDMKDLVDALPRGRVLHNYIVPGLRSTLLAGLPGGGKLRVFEMDRDQEHYVVPHTHRYSFHAWVLEGSVLQYCYDVYETKEALQAKWMVMHYDHVARALDPEPHQYLTGHIARKEFAKGERYGMRHDEYHSIRFSSGARVLMLEGPPIGKGMSRVLLPVVAGRVCDNFFVRDWMMEAADGA